MNLKNKKKQIAALKGEMALLTESNDFDELKSIKRQITKLENQISDHINHSHTKRYLHS